MAPSAPRGANTLVGRLCSLITLTPYANWGRQHGAHHANWNNLDRRTTGSDIYSACLTVREYQALTRWQRLLYRLPRHPLIAHILCRRWSSCCSIACPSTRAARAAERASPMPHWPRCSARWSCCSAGARSAGASADHGRGIDPGVWLFSLQHRFETARWLAGSD